MRRLSQNGVPWVSLQTAGDISCDEDWLDGLEGHMVCVTVEDLEES